MGTRFKVLNGTRSELAPRLCDTCQSGVVRRGAAESDEHIYCSFIRREVKIRVVECNVYSDRLQPSLWDLKQIAWVLDTDSKRTRIGFLRAHEWEKQHENEELIPSYLDSTK